MSFPGIPEQTVARATEWRRHLHGIPEIAYEEHQTSAFIAERLKDFGYRVERGYAGTGLVASLTKGGSPRRIGLRADIDALPITEMTGQPYQSTHPGRMHACGHDGHTAMLLAAAELAQAADFDGTVRFIFQPAEENEGGARRMLQDGLFRDFPVDAIYGLHNWPGLPVGSFAAMDGAMMAAFSVFDIEITGKGAHAAMPHEGVDPILAASAVVTELQSVVSRTISPMEAAVLTVTQFHAGDAYNVIPGTVRLAGTARWFSDTAGNLLEAGLERILRDVAHAHRCEARLKYERRYPATINHAPSAQTARRAAGLAGLATSDLPASMASEDFAFMLAEAPGAYAWLGAAREGSNPGLHSPYFDFNDAVIKSGIEFWLALIATELGTSPS